MRTRFLATDFSTGASAAVAQFKTLELLRLPLPNLPPPNYPSFSANLIQPFDEIPLVKFSEEFEKLPIDDALSMFLSDVLPHFVNCAGSEERSRAESFEVFRTEEKDASTSDDKAVTGLTFEQFEIPEIDLSLLPSMECSQIFSEVSAAECTMDTLNFEGRLHDHREIQQSVYSIDEMNVEYLMEQKADLLEYAASVQGELKSHNTKFPLFEVNVESLGILGKTCTADDLLNFESIEKQELTEQDAEISKNSELLGSMEIDLVKYVLHSCVETRDLEDTKVSSQLEYISIIELSPSQDYSTFRHVVQDDDSILAMDRTLFDEFMFLDSGLYHFSEVISDAAKEINVETCESMFGEAMHFRSFDDMIVCHELILMDDSFKSLPAPIFSDHGITSSLHILVEEIMAQLDWQSPSASDGLYLDWHFLGDYDCESGKYSSCLKMLWEIDTYNIDAAVNSTDNGKLIFDFIISEGHSNKPNAESYKETLNLCSSGVDVVHISSGKADSSSFLRNHDEGKRIIEDVSLKTIVEKVPIFGESMSSDLEFFLNPQNYSTTRESIPVNKSSDTNTLCQVLMSNDDSAAANASTGVQQKWNGELHQKTQKESETKLEELLDAIPLKESYGNGPAEAVNEDEDCAKKLVQSLSLGMESEKNLSCRPFCPETVIIVNTRNFNEEMVISRRSTYQRILEMEKEGTQVVERDICLPIDIILSPAVSVTWYDCKNIGRKASASDEAFSCLPLCVESIAATILTSLSFAFSCCILIFEGECNFLGNIMESSDELYAAAASLGVDMHLFCSYSPEMTEEIILSCINVAAKFSRGVFPKIPDSESLAESFLTAFPSINPLSAHAVLSSDVILGKFLQLSNEGRISALEKYQVPNESISLLNALTKYGEREDSKSGTTDCSSSVSASESGNVKIERASERKEPKYTCNPYNAGAPPKDLFDIGSLNLLTDDQLNPPKVSLSHNAWLSGNAEISDKRFDLSFNDELLSHSQEFDADMMRRIDKSNLYEFPVARHFDISYEKEKPRMPQINIDPNPRRQSATAPMSNFSRPSIKVPNTSQENFVGEVIDVDDTPASIENFCAANLGSFSPFLVDVEKDYAARNSRMSKRPMGATNYLMSNNPDDIHSSPGVWISAKDNGQMLREEIKPHYGTSRRSDISAKRQKGLVEEYTIQRAPENFYKQTNQESNNPRSFGSTPLSTALHSTQLQQGSPWTDEFLNKVREKSRLHKQSISYDLSSPNIGSSGNTSMAAKRKSPSIIQFYKYEGGSTPQKIVDQKRQKTSSQPLNSLKNKNAFAPCPSSWTPLDKRARRTLSFSSNGNRGQRKLVWSDKNSRNSERRL